MTIADHDPSKRVSKVRLHENDDILTDFLTLEPVSLLIFNRSLSKRMRIFFLMCILIDLKIMIIFFSSAVTGINKICFSCCVTIVIFLKSSFQFSILSISKQNKLVVSSLHFWLTFCLRNTLGPQRMALEDVSAYTSQLLCLQRFSSNCLRRKIQIRIRFNAEK